MGSWYPCILSFSTSNSKLIFNLRFTKWLEPLGWRNRREKIFLGADREMLLSWSSWRLELHFLCMVEIRVFGGDFGNTTCKNGFIYCVFPWIHRGRQVLLFSYAIRPKHSNKWPVFSLFGSLSSTLFSS